MKENIYILAGQLYERKGDKDSSLATYEKLYTATKDSDIKEKTATKILDIQLATNKLDDDTIALLRDKNISGVMYANSKMSFWAQSIDINFDMYDLNGNNLWLDTLEGYSYYIIGDTGSPTKQMNYQIVIADVLKFQQKHADELYIIIDEAVSNGVYTLKNKVPYAFSTNDILFTQKTFSLTNEEYAKKAGIK